MYTITVAGGLSEAPHIFDLMHEIYPDGTHRIVTGILDVMRIIENAGPDIIWMAANDENFRAAAEGRRISEETNYIFIGDDAAQALDAIRVRASGFILEPVTEEAVRLELSELRHPVPQDDALLRVQCFGNFEVFRDGKAVRFSRSLSKEAFAYLVDRRGAGCTVSEICSVLWENRPVDTNLKSQCRVVLTSMKKDLEAAGAGDVLVKGWNTWGIDTDKVSCDYYDFLTSGSRMPNTYNGEYMAQYSWGEMTGGSIYQMMNERQKVSTRKTS